MSSIEQTKQATLLEKVWRVKNQALSSGVLFLGAVSLYNFDRYNPTLPYLLQGRIVDAVGTAAHSALQETFLNFVINPEPDFEPQTFTEKIIKGLAYRPFMSSLSAFIIQSFYEIGQMNGAISGTYDPGDFIAYAAGSAAWVGLNLVADYLHTPTSKKTTENIS